MTSQTDRELTPWLYGIVNSLPVEAGGFLKSLADTALRADVETYFVLRPALLLIKKKYPTYHDPKAEVSDVNG